MIIKEKFTSLPIDIFGYDFNVYYVRNDNTFWYEVIANKNDKEYFVCKFEYGKTYQGIKTFLLKDVANDLKEKYKRLNFKVFKNSIKVNDKLFCWKKQKQDKSFYPIYDLKVEIIQHIIDLKNKNILVE